MGITFWELWQSMHLFARGVAFVLLFMSLLVAAISVRKLFELRRSRRATLRFAGPFSEALSNEDFNEAERLVEAYPKSHLATVFRRVFPNLTFHSQDLNLSAAEIASVQRMFDLNTLEQL